MFSDIKTVQDAVLSCSKEPESVVINDDSTGETWTGFPWNIPTYLEKKVISNLFSDNEPDANGVLILTI